MFACLHNLVSQMLSGRSPATVSFFSLAILMLLGWVDYISGDYSLIVFYLVPVSFTAWFVSRRTGLLFCVLALITRFVADEATKSFALHSAQLHYWNEFIEFVFLMIMSLLFSALRKNLEKEKSLARTDHLTGALNRRSFFDLAEYELKRSRRYSQPFTVAYIDLDNFKGVNDRLGHSAGDELLVNVVATIKNNIRSTDMLSRFGGDEFVVLLPETPGEAAGPFLNKLHASLTETMRSHNWPVTFSIGAVTYSSPPRSVDDFICQADELMYRAKHSGKNQLLHTTIQEAENHG